jgi:hypothetical protein
MTGIVVEDMAQSHQKRKSVSKKVFPYALAALCVIFMFFVLTGEWSFKSERQTVFSLFSAAVFFFVFHIKKNRTILLQRMTLIFLILLAQCLLYFAGLFYGTYPKFALRELFLNIGGLFIFAAAYVSFRRDELNLRRFALWLSAVIAFASVVSIELATSGYLIGIFKFLSGIISAQLPSNYGAFEANTRILTVMDNANVYAPIATLGMFLSLWLSGGMGERSRRNLFLMSCAGACAAAFILCFSMGTILAYIAAVTVYILTAKKGSRGAVFGKHTWCLVTGLIAAAAVFGLKTISILPLLAALTISIGSAFFYGRLRPFRAVIVNKKAKTAALIGGAAVIAVVIAGAVSLRSGYRLDPNGSFRRAVALGEGTYSIQIHFNSSEADATVSVDISSMSYEQAALKEKTVLKTAILRSGENASFDVPSSSAAVFFASSANKSLTVTDIKILGAGGTKALPLKYLILPEFIVNRLQAIWVNDNAIQRFVFFRDGIRLGMTSPVIGLGGGAFEGGLFGVADYYYMTKHPHNEFIQRFIDGGIIGLLFFTALPVFIVRALVRSRKSGDPDKVYPLLCGSMALIFLHALLEVDFMYPAYRVITAILFAAVAARYDDPAVSKRGLNTVLGSVVSLSCVATLLLSAGRIAAARLFAGSPTASQLRTAMVMDPCDIDDYQLSYLLFAAGTSDKTVQLTAGRYLASLQEKKLSSESAFYLAQYYLSETKPEVDKAVLKAEYAIHVSRVNPEIWDRVFWLYNLSLESQTLSPNDTAKIEASIRSLCGYLIQLNSELPVSIHPKYAAFSYLRVSQQASAVSEGTILVDSRTACDLDHNGLSDLIGNDAGGQILHEIDIVLNPSIDYSVKVFLPQSAGCEIAFDGAVRESTYIVDEGCYETHVSKLPETYSHLTIKTPKFPDTAYFTIVRSR